MSLIHNPILPGFHPDPSLCRVGEDYYLVTSSFEYFPGVPIYHSRDLVNWRQIGHCLTRTSQLDLEGRPASLGIFAPTIRFHQDRFYMITTNVGGKGNFYVTASDPAEAWSEPVWVDADVFDPSLFFDDDGKVYYTRRGTVGIVQAEIDMRSGQLKHAPRLLTSGFICSDIEGPHLYKIDGRYYLMAAEGGSRFGHCEVIGRADNPWGPFDPCPHNPILTHRDQAHGPIRDLGHAELVEDHLGNWWIFCLGTRHRQYNNATILGRETFLAPLTWTADGWPLVNGNGRMPESFESSLLPAQSSVRPFHDDFDSPSLDFEWNFLRNPHETDWSLSQRPGWLRLYGSPVALYDTASPAFLGRRQDAFDFSASSLVDFVPQSPNEQAGMTVLMNNQFHYDLVITMHNGRRCVAVMKQVGDMFEEIYSAPVDDNPLRLEISSDGQTYTFRYQTQSEQATLASGLCRLICSEIADPGNAWTGVYIGLFASGNGQPNHAPADFDWFEYRRR